jgi:hypothetical protein
VSNEGFASYQPVVASWSRGCGKRWRDKNC